MEGLKIEIKIFTNTFWNLTVVLCIISQWLKPTNKEITFLLEMHYLPVDKGSLGMPGPGE